MIFATPLFLIGLLAGAVPVLLHMIHRQKAPEVPFSTLRFLHLSVQRTRRRKLIDDLLLLSLRVATLVLIALALAGPIVTSLGSLWGRGRSSAVAIILDNSASMGTIDDGKPRLETARAAAEQILDLLHEGDAVALIPTGGAPAPEHGKLVHAHETVRQALAQCKMSYERADLAGKLQQARALLEQSDLPNREIYVVTDNQALSWDGLKETAADAEKSVSIIVVQVNKDPLPNVAIRSVRLESPAPAVGVPITAAVEVVNPGLIPQPRNVELLIDGRKEALSPTLTLSAGGTARHEFRFVLDRPGIHRGEVRLAEEDGCPHDNRRFFVVAVDQQVTVAVVVPRRNPIALADDSYYLERVLAPTGGDGWSIRPQVVTIDSLASEALARFAVIFCVNLAALEPALAAKLGDYIEAGGHVVWICGDNVQADAYQRMHDQAGGKLLPMALGPLHEAQDAKESWKIAALDKDHPALSGLSEPASLYQSVLVHKHFPMQPLPDQKARVLAQLPGEQPLLVERSVGAGSVLMLGTAAHPEWTNLPLRPIFLPLMARLTFRLAGVEADRSQSLAGAPLSIPLPGAVEAGELEVVQPSSDVTRLSVKSSGRVFRFADTHEIGIYLFRWLSVKDAKLLAFAVNVDPDESDAALMPRDELTQKLGRELLAFCDQPQEVATTVQRLHEGQSLWELFLFATLGVLMVEAFVANVRGRKPDKVLRPK